MELKENRKEEFQYEIWLLKKIFKNISPESIEEYFSLVDLAVLSLTSKELNIAILKKRKKRNGTKTTSIYAVCFRLKYFDLAFKWKMRKYFQWDERKCTMKQLTSIFSYGGGNCKSVELILKEFFPFKYKVIGNIEFVRSKILQFKYKLIEKKNPIKDNQGFYLFSRGDLERCFNHVTSKEKGFKDNYSILEAFFFSAFQNENVDIVDDFIFSLKKTNNNLFRIGSISILAGYALSGNSKMFFDFWEKLKLKTNQTMQNELIHIENICICAIVGGDQTIFNCVYNAFCNLLSPSKREFLCDMIYLSGEWGVYKDNDIFTNGKYEFDMNFLFYAPLQKSPYGIKVIMQNLHNEKIFPIEIAEKDKFYYKEFYRTINLESIICIIDFVKSISLESIVRILFLDNPEKVEIVNILLSCVEKKLGCLKIKKGSKVWVGEIKEIYPLIAKRIKNILYPNILL